MTKPSRKVALAGAAVLAAAAAAAAATTTTTAVVQADTDKPGSSGTVQAAPEGPNKWTAPPPDPAP
jgi:hypothetical protein